MEWDRGDTKTEKNQHAHFPGSHYIRQGVEGVNGADLPTDNPV